jgi:hypothetical protein
VRFGWFFFSSSIPFLYIFFWALRLAYATEGDLVEHIQMHERTGRRLRFYVDALLAEVLKQKDDLMAAIMTGLPRLQQERSLPAGLETMPLDDLRRVCLAKQHDNDKLEVYVNLVRFAWFLFN